MTYNARIVFRGLCQFVPSNNDLQQQQSWLGVFLVNASKRSGTPGRPLEIHHPYMRFVHSDLAGQEGAPSVKQVMELQRKDVGLFAPYAAESSISFNFSPTPGQDPGNDQVKRMYFNWVPDIESIVTGSGAMLDSCFQSDPRQLVSTRVHLSQGTVRTSDLGRFDGQNLIVQFHPTAKAPVIQAVAVEVALDLHGIVGRFKVRMRDFGGANIKELVFRDFAQDELLSIEFGNLCARDLDGDKSDAPYPLPDFDFGWHYLLSNNFGGSVPDIPTIPVPFKFNLGGSGGGEFCEMYRCQIHGPGSGKFSKNA